MRRKTKLCLVACALGLIMCASGALAWSVGWSGRQRVEPKKTGYELHAMIMEDESGKYMYKTARLACHVRITTLAATQVKWVERLEYLLPTLSVHEFSTQPIKAQARPLDGGNEIEISPQEAQITFSDFQDFATELPAVFAVVKDRSVHEAHQVRRYQYTKSDVLCASGFAVGCIGVLAFGVGGLTLIFGRGGNTSNTLPG